MTMILYDYFRSSASYRVRIALNIKCLKYEIKPIDLANAGRDHLTAAYREINPQQQVPTLIDADVKLIQSMSIIEYLEECYPATPPILPELPADRAYVRALAQLVACDIHPLNNLRVRQYITEVLACPDNAKSAWCQHWIGQGLSAFESLLQQSGKVGTYCFGEKVTLADVFLIPQVFNAKRFECLLADYPLIMKINEQCLAQEAFIKAQPCVN